MLIGISGHIGSGKDTVAKMIQWLTVDHRDRPDLNTIDAKMKLALQYCTKDIPLNNRATWGIKKFAGKLKQICSLLTGIPVADFELQSVKDSYLGPEWDIPIRSVAVGSKAYCGEGQYFQTAKSGTTKFIIQRMKVRELLQLMGTDAMRDKVHPNIHINALFADYKSLSERQLTSIEASRLMSIWKNINTRCTNPNYEKYHRYGGKGISNEFSSFVKFAEWATKTGYTNELTLDRRDGNKNYNSENCGWVTSDLQAFNKQVYESSLSGTKGVSIKTERIGKSPGKPWVAQIQVKGKKVHIGYYDTKEEADKAYQEYYSLILSSLEQESLAQLYKPQYPNWIISDLRFVNEAEAIKQKGGICIRVNRWLEDLDKTDTRHESETALDNYQFDHVIDNSGSLEELLNQVRTLLLDLKIIS